MLGTGEKMTCIVRTRPRISCMAARYLMLRRWWAGNMPQSFIVFLFYGRVRAKVVEYKMMERRRSQEDSPQRAGPQGSRFYHC